MFSENKFLKIDSNRSKTGTACRAPTGDGVCVASTDRLRRRSEGGLKSAPTKPEAGGAEMVMRVAEARGSLVFAEAVEEHEEEGADDGVDGGADGQVHGEPGFGLRE